MRVSRRSVEEKSNAFIVQFWQRINENMQLWFMRFMWHEFSICFLFLLHMYFVMFYRPFIIISSWMLLSDRGRIQFTALPWKSIHTLCVSFCLKRIHVYALFILSTVFPLHIISMWLLNFLPILPHEILCVFELISLLMLSFVPYIPKNSVIH